MQIGEGDFRNRIAAERDAAQHAEGHDNQDDAEDGIQLADQLVDGKQRRQHIIDQDDRDPELLIQGRGGQPRDQRRRAVDEYRSRQDQKHDGEHAHHPFGRAAQIDAGELGDGIAPVAAGDHAGHIIVHRAAQDRAEYDPQEHHRAEAGAHQRAEDRPRAGDVQKLHQKGLPGLHGHAVDAVIDGDGRGLPVIGGENPFHDPAVHGISNHQDNQGKYQ